MLADKLRGAVSKPPFEVIGTSYSSASSGTGTINYPTGTQEGDLLLLLFGSDANFRDADFVDPSGWSVIYRPASDQLFYAFYKIAGSETSLSYNTGRTTNDNGCAMISIRSASYVQSNTLFSDSAVSPFSFNAFSGATTGNSVVCFAVADDDVTTGASVSQTGFSIELAQFVGTQSGAGVSLYITFAEGIINSSTYTPPALSDSDIVQETGVTLAIEVSES